MARTRSDFLLIAACVSGMIAGAPAWAADLSIPPALAAAPGAHAAALAAGVRDARERGKRAARAEKTPRPEKARLRRIVTYKLFNDPDFRLAGAVGDSRDLAFVSAAGSPGAPLPYVPGALPGGPAFKAADGAGVAFGCREKSSGAAAFPRVVTACYRVQLDKSWKTQTYVSKGLADGNSGWGGGLSVSYAH